MKNYILISQKLWFQEGPGVRKNQYTVDGVKLINVANLVDGKVDLSTSDRYVSNETAYGKYKHFLVDEGDFVIASSGIKVDYFDKKMGIIEKRHLPLCMNTSTIRFKVLNERELSIKYFMYYLKSNHFKEQLTREITGSAQLNFGPSHLKKMVFPYVPRVVQDKIVDILDQIYKIEDALKSKAELLDKLVKSRFIELFGEVNHSNKFAYKRVLDFTKVISGGTPARNKPEYWSPQIIPWIKTTELQNNVIDNAEERISGDGLNSSAAKVLPKNTVLIAMYGQGKTRGMTGFLTIEACTNQACAAILPSEDFNPMFLWMYFIMSYDDLRDLAKGGNQPNLNCEIIKNYRVICPPISLQNEFVDFFKQVDKSKLAVQKSLDELEILKKSLMQKYFG